MTPSDSHPVEGEDGDPPGLPGSGLDDGAALAADPRNRTRYLNRLGTDLFLRIGISLAQVFDGDLLSGLVWVTTAHLNVRHLNQPRVLNPLADGGLFPDSMRVAAPAYSVAKYLGLPRETVRRHLHRLVARNYCSLTEGEGFMVTRDILQRPELVRMARMVEGEVGALVDDLKTSNLL